MRNILPIFIMILFLALVLYAQNTPPTYLSPEHAIRIPAKLRPEIAVIYRRTSKEEAKTLKPDSEDINEYADFLKQSETGLTRLVNDSGCAENYNIIVVTSKCLKLTMPGAGSSFSFRTKDYRVSRLADLTFSSNVFQTTGGLLHGILTTVGDIPLENVNLQTKGLEFLTDFEPATDYEQAQKIAQELQKGINKEGFAYRSEINAYENETYILRSIAYKGVLYRTFKGIKYNELDFDKRKDVIIAFRIIRKNIDGSITILWKRLMEKDSPKIKRKNK